MHYWSVEWTRYMQQVNEYMQYQTQQIQQLNGKLEALEKQIAELKKNSTQPPVINNEYRFDLLKVERLEGTLNIGLNPNPGDKDSSIEELAIGQSMDIPKGAEQQAQFQGIQEQVQNYLNSDAYRTLEHIEERYRYPLDEPYRKFIVEDVKKQIDERIRYYIQNHPETAENKEQSIINDVKRDIEKTFEAFIKNLPRKDEGPGWNST
ncbi:spore gernimation protein [Paenibacillus rigui]|uniref:Spore gernimation protein n=2 Tax=Paenibacillus rigui TaxID=554312 RepID=A0A229UU01_9BACL|nr:spore gernimation protein [Paenibacillus rigui]